MKQCQYEVINNSVSKQIAYDGILEITFCCENKKENNKSYVRIFVDSEASPLYDKCIGDGMKELCNDCKNQSAASV
jgi:hypothetical protein